MVDDPTKGKGVFVAASELVYDKPWDNCHAFTMNNFHVRFHGGRTATVAGEPSLLVNGKPCKSCNAFTMKNLHGFFMVNALHLSRG